jgi:hypothetical protein
MVEVVEIIVDTEAVVIIVAVVADIIRVVATATAATEEEVQVAAAGDLAITEIEV